MGNVGGVIGAPIQPKRHFNVGPLRLNTSHPLYGRDKTVPWDERHYSFGLERVGGKDFYFVEALNQSPFNSENNEPVSDFEIVIPKGESRIVVVDSPRGKAGKPERREVYRPSDPGYPKWVRYLKEIVAHPDRHFGGDPRFKSRYQNYREVCRVINKL